MEKRFRGRKLHIHVQNPRHVQSGVRSLVLNGKSLPDNFIPEGLLQETNEIWITL